MSNVIETRMTASESTKPDTSRQPRLHNVRSIGIATFLGSPLAGGILFAHNCIKLSRILEAVLVILVSILATACMVGIGLAVPATASLGYLLPLAAALSIQKISKSVFKVEFERIRNSQAKSHSVWTGVLVGILVSVAMIAVFLLAI